MPTPFTDAPDTLLHLWNKLSLSGDLDGSNPPATMREAYNQARESWAYANANPSTHPWQNLPGFGLFALSKHQHQT